MAVGNQVAIVGNLTDDPELRYTGSGTPVASFRVAVNRSRKNPDTGQWEDVETSFFKCNVWRQQAENVAETLTKGMRAVVIGRLRQREWETQDGQKRFVVEIEADSVGPSLEWAKADVTKSSGRGDSGPAFASSPAQGSSDNGAPDEEPPF